MKHTIEHDLSEEETKLTVQRALTQYCERYAEYSPFMVWRDETHADMGFSVKGLKLSGTLALRPHAVDIDLSVPLPLLVFKKMAISAIDKEVRAAIDTTHRARSQGASASAAGSAS